MVVDDVVLHGHDPENGRRLVCVQEARRRQSLDSKVILYDVVFLNTVFYEEGVAHDHVYNIVLQAQAVGGVNGRAAVP